MILAHQTPTRSITPPPAQRAIDSPRGLCPWLPFTDDSPSRMGFDGYLIANSIGGAV